MAATLKFIDYNVAMTFILLIIIIIIWRRPVQMALAVYELLLPMSYILAVRLHDIARLQL